MGNKANKAINGTEAFEDLSQKTNFSKDEINRWLEIFKKEFPKGKMNKKDAFRVISREFPTGCIRQYCDYMFKAFDLNGDGTVDFREFLISKSILADGSVEEKICWIFRMYDINNDNYIQKHELRKIFKAIFIGLQLSNPAKRAAEAADKVIACGDLNGDGKLSEEEFVQHMSARMSSFMGSASQPCENTRI